VEVGIEETGSVDEATELSGVGAESVVEAESPESIVEVAVDSVEVAMEFVEEAVSFVEDATESVVEAVSSVVEVAVESVEVEIESVVEAVESIVVEATVEVAVEEAIADPFQEKSTILFIVIVPPFSNPWTTILSPMDILFKESWV
jgi:isopropylmalate/homocitrate/citramalate synthase